MSRCSALAIIGLLAALAASLLGATPAYAHAIVVRSEPADGASLSVAPKQLRLWFSEPIAPGFTKLELVDGDGRHIAVQEHLDAASLALTVRSGESAGAVLLVVDLPRLTPNVYRLNWSTLSNNDLHATGGSIVFGVGRAAESSAATVVAPAPSPLEVVLRWLNFGGIAGLVGALAVAWLAAKGQEPRSGDYEHETERREPGTTSEETALVRKLARLARGAALLALVAGSALLIAQELSTGAFDIAALWRIVVTTGYGWAWALRQLVLAAFVSLLWLPLPMGRRFGRSSPFRSRLSPATVPTLRAAPTQLRAVFPSPHARTAQPHPAPSIYPAWRIRYAPLLLPALALAQAFGSHATAFDTISPPRVLADALHLLAAGLWSGGLLALAVAVVPLLRHGAAPATLARAILRRFGALAAAALAALLVSGLFMTGQQVASLDALLTTFYGRTLLIKVALVLGVALLGLRNAAALHSAVAGLMCLRESAVGLGGLPRRVAIEAAGAVLLLLLAANLSAAQPARGPEFVAPPATAGIPAATTKAGDLIVTLTVKPNLPGRNFVSLGVFNTRRPAPAPIETVSVGVEGPGVSGLTVTAEKLTDERYQVVDDVLASAGNWRFTMLVRRPGQPDAIATIPWTVAAPQPRPVLVSNRPLAPLLTPAALFVAAVLLITVLAGRFGRTAGIRARELAELLSRSSRAREIPPERRQPAEERVLR